MVFNIKRLFRISSDKHGRKGPQTDTDSPSEDDVYSQRLQNDPSSRHWASSSSNSLWNLTKSKDDLQSGQSRQNGHGQSGQNVQKQQTDTSSTKGIRIKAPRIGRGKEHGGYFNNLAAGGGAISNGSEPKLDAMFDELRDPSQDAKDALGVESTMAYLTSLGLNPESGEVFVALELVQAPSLGEITRKGFVDGWKTSGSVTKEEQAKYITTLLKHFSTDLAYFKRVYRYTFGAGKEPDQRSMSLENAIEFWKVLFAAPGRPWKTASRDWTPLWIAFLEEKWTRSVNRDMWNQTLEFAIKCSEDETLGFWNEDGAWPSVIDDFVAWCNEKGYTGNKKDSMDTSE